MNYRPKMIFHFDILEKAVLWYNEFMKTKKCKLCGQEKSLGDYYSHPETADKHLHICKECQKRKAKIRAQTPEGKASEKKRNQKEKRKKDSFRNSQKWRKENPEKALAHSRLWHAIYNGSVVRKNECEECGSKQKIHAHHSDYSKPYSVEWLCPSCHGKRHPNYKPLPF